MIDKSSKYERALKLASGKNPNYTDAYRLLYSSYKSGEPRAAYAIGSWFLYGRHVKKNLKSAIKYFRKAADKNIPEALFELGSLYEKGRGVRKNERIALDYYLKSAIHGDDDAIFEVGRCYFYGIGTKVDRRTGRIWLKIADERGVGRFVED